MTPRDSTATRVGIALAVIAAGLIAYATLTPGPPPLDRSLYGPVCVICDGTPGVDLIANIVLFVPLGLGLALAGIRSSRAITAMVALSIAIELLQYRFIQGRDANVVDVVTNAIGGAVGVIAGQHWRALVMPDARASRALGAVAGIGLLATIWVTAWALTPSLPNPPWFSIRSAGSPLQPSGRVIAASVAGEPLTSDSVHNGESIRAGLLRGAPAVATAIVSSSADQSTHLLQVVDGAIDDVVVLSRAKADATFSIRNHGRAARLREVAVRLPGIFRAIGDDTVEVTGRVRDGSLVIGARRGVDTRETAMRLTPRLGWALLVPATRVGTESVIAGALWLGVLVFPFAYWSARAARLSGDRLQWAVARLLVVVGCFAVPSFVLPIGDSLWWEWAVGILTIGAAEAIVASSVGRPDPPGQRGRSSFGAS